MRHYCFAADPPPTALYTLSLHDALPISPGYRIQVADTVGAGDAFAAAFLHGIGAGWPLKEIGDFANRRRFRAEDRKSTRLNSSHITISYAVFCLKKKKKV